MEQELQEVGIPVHEAREHAETVTERVSTTYLFLSSNEIKIFLIISWLNVQGVNNI